MRFPYFLEYSEANSARAEQALYDLYGDKSYDLDYEDGTLIVYTHMRPMDVEDDVYAISGVYAENYGRL